jgi:tetratricopeptide (TPR) repeat protein
MRYWASVFGLGLCLASASAAAEDRHDYPECTSKPTDADVEGAQGAFKAGKARYDEGNRERAILYWEDAYRMDCTAHDLLINLATAYELQGNKEQALLALETYLKRVPESKKREQVSRRIEQLKSQIDSEKKKAQAALPAAAPASPGQPAAGQGTSATGAALGTAAPGAGSGEPPPTSSSRRRPLAPLILAGAGGVVTIVGLGMFAAASSDVQSYEKQCGPGGKQCPSPAIAQKANDAVQRRNAAGGVTVVGLAVTGAGLLWYFLSKPQPSPAPQALELSPSTRLSPTVGRSFAGLEFSGAF